MVGFQQSSAPTGYLLVDGMPVTTQLSGHFLNSAAGLADLLGRPPSRPGGQQRPLRGDLGVLFGERTNFAGLVGALPAGFRQLRRAGRPNEGRSTSSTTRVPFDHRGPPQPGHRGRGFRQRTSTSTPPPRGSPTPQTSTSSNPTNTPAHARRIAFHRGPPHSGMNYKRPIMEDPTPDPVDSLPHPARPLHRPLPPHFRRACYIDSIAL